VLQILLASDDLLSKIMILLYMNHRQSNMTAIYRTLGYKDRFKIRFETANFRPIVSNAKSAPVTCIWLAEEA
jgi:hypothetical protein